MKRMSAKTRIAVGQVFLLLAVLMTAMMLRIVPDRREQVLEARVRERDVQRLLPRRVEATEGAFPHRSAPFPSSWC